MVTAESLACGTPVVGFCAGAPEQITIPEYSEFVAYGDFEALSAATVNMLEITADKEKISKAGMEKYAKERMTEAYFNVYTRLLNGQ